MNAAPEVFDVVRAIAAFLFIGGGVGAIFALGGMAVDRYLAIVHERDCEHCRTAASKEAS